VSEWRPFSAAKEQNFTATRSRFRKLSTKPGPAQAALTLSTFLRLAHLWVESARLPTLHSESD